MRRSVLHTLPVLCVCRLTRSSLLSRSICHGDEPSFHGRTRGSAPASAGLSEAAPGRAVRRGGPTPGDRRATKIEIVVPATSVWWVRPGEHRSCVMPSGCCRTCCDTTPHREAIFSSLCGAASRSCVAAVLEQQDRGSSESVTPRQHRAAFRLAGSHHQESLPSLPRLSSRTRWTPPIGWRTDLVGTDHAQPAGDQDHRARAASRAAATASSMPVVTSLCQSLASMH